MKIFLDGDEGVEFPSTADVVNAPRGAALAPFAAINSTTEVDLLGQVGAETAGVRVVGGVGDQSDCLRAAHHDADGTAVVALTAGARSASRIVPFL